MTLFQIVTNSDCVFKAHVFKVFQTTMIAVFKAHVFKVFQTTVIAFFKAHVFKVFQTTVILQFWILDSTMGQNIASPLMKLYQNLENKIV